MKVINFSKSDWANFSYDNSMSLCSVGVDSKSYVLIPHPFNYSHTSEVAPLKKVMEEMQTADFVQIFHSDIEALNIFINSKSKAKLIVYHAGSVYRRDPKTYNKIFNGIAHKSVIALPEFSGLGCKNEQYSVGAIDTDRIYANPSHPQKPYTYGHFPSNAEVKGTDEIVDMMREMDIKLRYSIDRVDVSKQYERRRECDIYIELFKPLLEGKPYGSFGITALEAASMGKIVVTQNLNSDVYFNEYGDCKLLNATSKDIFKDVIFMLNLLSPKEITKMQDETRQWVVDNHSYKATGKRLLEKVLC